jgi:hypothetical protein
MPARSCIHVERGLDAESFNREKNRVTIFLFLCRVIGLNKACMVLALFEVNAFRVFRTNLCIIEFKFRTLYRCPSLPALCHAPCCAVEMSQPESSGFKFDLSAASEAPSQ